MERFSFVRFVLASSHGTSFPNADTAGHLRKVMLGVMATCLGLVAFDAIAQELRYDQKYLERIQQSQDIGRYSASSFGDQINLKNGGVEFRWTDVDIPGNSKLPVRLQRSLVIEDQSAGRSGSLGGFDVGGAIDIPYLKGVFASSGWQVTGSNPNARCSAPGAPPGTSSIPSRDFWSGNWLHLPWGGEQLMLPSAGSPLPAPSDGVSHPWVTKDFWRISCLAATKNGYPGEGFVALSPEGDRYYFDWVVTKTHPTMSKRIGNYSASASVSRVAVFFLVSRIEDRFGNWVSYTYNGDQLARIDASDGRFIRVTSMSGSNIAAVETSVGNWSYAYSAGALTVTRPDGSQSRYAQTGQMLVYPTPSLPLYDGTPNCPAPEPSTGSFSYQVTLPSNATASYAFQAQRHYTHNVPKICNSFLDAAGPSTSYQFLSIPNFTDSFTLISKTVSGPGLPSRQWTYSYEIGAQPLAFESRCSTSTGTVCSKTIQTEVRGPEGEMQRYTFGAWYLYNSGQDMGVETGSLVGSGGSQVFNVLSKTENEYITSEEVAGMPFPDQVGPTTLNDYVASAALRPLKGRTITQQGETFHFTVNAFDVFARPISVTRSSSLGDSLSETTVYSDNFAKWVLGQTASVTKTSPGLAQVMSAVTYDATTALPTHLRRFGQLQQTVSYNTDGTVATVTDGNSNTTTLSNWKLGLPQTVGYANGTQESAVVDSRGWISSTTDENGFTTSYTYDAMGRLSGITYPAGDTVTWLPTTVAFVPVASAEFGIPAGHWRLTVSTGNARKITYMDGYWQPLLVQEYDAANQAGTQRFSRFSYDGKGRTVFSSYPSTADSASTGNWTTYDALDRPTSVSQDSEQGILTTTTEYLPGLITRTTNPRLKATVIGYMAYDTPSTDWPVSFSLPEGVYLDIDRDEHGKPLTITRRNADGSLAVARSYSYDSYQQLCRSVEPESGATLSGYDGAGNLAWSASGLPVDQACEANGTTTAVAVRKVSRTYDARNQIKSLSYLDQQVQGSPLPGTFITTYNYYPDGKLQAMASNDPAGNLVTTTYSYNRRRFPTGERLQWGDVDWSVGYGYDANGSLATQISPDLNLDFAPNAMGQPTKAGSYATGVSYFPNGAVKQFTYGNGIVHSMVQNARQLPARSSDTGGGYPLDMAYAYDQAGNVSNVTDYASGRQTRAMTYDGLDRLLTAQSAMFGGSPAAYSYDVLDNLKSVNIKGRDWSYVYNARNQLQNIMSGGATVGGLDYDEQGNLKNKSGTNFRFDYGNRLREVVGRANYLYDGAGRRVLDFTTGAKRSFYSQSGQLLYADDQRQGKTTAYVYLAGSLVAGVSNYTGPLPPAPTSAPTLSAPASNSTGAYTISWSSVATASSYKLEESSDGGASWNQISNANDTTSQVAGRLGGTYSYRVSACNRGGCGPLSSVGSTTVARPPVSSPTLTVPVTNNTGGYSVSWTAVATATSYTLEESVNGGSTWTQVYSGPATSAPVSGKTNGTYSYRALASNPNGAGPYSAVVTTTVSLPPQTAPALTVPGPANNTTGSYTVSWSAVALASRYELEESADGGGNWTQRYNGSALSWPASGKGSGTYTYRVRACNAIDCGPYSSLASITVLLAPTGAPTPSAPSSSYTGTYTVTWTSVVGAAWYVVQESMSSGAFADVGVLAPTSILISGKGSASYRYQVRACNSTGCGPWSSVATVVVILPPTTAPTLSIPATSTNGSYGMSWTSVQTSINYQVDESTDSGASWHAFITTSELGASASGKGDGTYLYRVRACNVAGCSSVYSAAVSISVVLPPPVPTGLLVTYPRPVNNVVKYRASWNASAGADNYELDGLWGYSGPLTRATMTISGTPTGSYKVRACKQGVCSAWSASVVAQEL